MKTYEVTSLAVYRRSAIIEANSEEEACQKAWDNYLWAEKELVVDDFDDVCAKELK